MKERTRRGAPPLRLLALDHDMARRRPGIHTLLAVFLVLVPFIVSTYDAK
jgi:hypothetical protein